ncbi:hypothetical protein JW960_24080 [candidate division KSB1 bacterium]|nr:hypothetical protein [candidate division KSB1 bacterium]
MTFGNCVILGTDATLEHEHEFSCYPNPFGDFSHPTTSFNYYIAHDSDITLEIYSVDNEMVWKQTFSSKEPQGKAGLHDGSNTIKWDGRNDSGTIQLSGIYLAYLVINNSARTHTQIAIVK